MYPLEELIEIFKQHSDLAEIKRQELIQTHKETYEGSELPEHLKDEFNLPLALHSICVEIDKLWIAIGGR